MLLTVIVFILESFGVKLLSADHLGYMIVCGISDNSICYVGGSMSMNILIKRLILS